MADPAPSLRPPGAERARGRADAMRALSGWLADVGYERLYPLVTGGELFARDAAHASAALGSLDGLGPESLASLRLFAAGMPLAPGADLGRASAAVASLRASGLLVERPDGSLETEKFLVVPVLGGLLATGTPPTYDRRRGEGGTDPEAPPGVGASAYLGPDSVRLANAIPDPRGKRVLDLGTGCGIQGLLAARGATEVVATDVEVRSLELAALNAAMNDTPHPVRFVESDCYDSIPGERFDLVVTLPPYVPALEGGLLRQTVSAGRDGLAVLRRVLAGAREHLVEGGTLVARCQLLCGSAGPLLLDELPSLTGSCEVRLLLGSALPLQPYVAELAAAVAEHGGASDFGTLYRTGLASLRSLGATAVCSATIEATAVSGRGEVRVVAPRPRRRPPAPARGITLAPDPGARRASAFGVPAVLLDGPSAALLGAVDGHRDLEHLVAHAWGAPSGADPRDLADQARARLAQLASFGLLDDE